MFIAKANEVSTRIEVLYETRIKGQKLVQPFAYIDTMLYRSISVIDQEKQIFGCKVNPNDELKLRVENLTQNFNIGFPCFINDSNVYLGAKDLSELSECGTNDMWEIGSTYGRFTIKGFYVPKSKEQQILKFVNDQDANYVSLKLFGTMAKKAENKDAEYGSRGVGVEVARVEQLATVTTNFDYFTPEYILEMRYHF
jgi:hypothetical protein